ncbi:TOBE domain-containing protein [Endothiovibrio diazotrophicus]
MDSLSMEMRMDHLLVSSRNRYPGTVNTVRMGPVSAEIEVDLNGRDRLIATITQASAEALGLRPGSEVVALVKATSVLLSAGETPPRVSARNVYCGTVGGIENGPVNGQLAVITPGGLEVVALITRESIHRLGLAVGAPACALFKASSVILALPIDPAC